MIILDQTRLPKEEIYEEMQTREDVWDAIYKLKVRGAPAIGVAAAYGLCLAVRDCPEEDMECFEMRLKEDAEYLATARPTAVNLSWALKRLVRHFEELRPKTVQQAKKELLLEARRIQEEDESACLARDSMAFRCSGRAWEF